MSRIESGRQKTNIICLENCHQSRSKAMWKWSIELAGNTIRARRFLTLHFRNCRFNLVQSDGCLHYSALFIVRSRKSEQATVICSKILTVTASKEFPIIIKESIKNSRCIAVGATAILNFQYFLHKSSFSFITRAWRGGCSSRNRRDLDLIEVPLYLLVANCWSSAFKLLISSKYAPGFILSSSCSSIKVHPSSRRWCLFRNASLPEASIVKLFISCLNKSHFWKTESSLHDHVSLKQVDTSR